MEPNSQQNAICNGKRYDPMWRVGNLGVTEGKKENAILARATAGVWGRWGNSARRRGGTEWV